MGWAVLFGLGLIAAVTYACSCWLWPWAACRNPKCDGGRIRREDRRVWKDCRRCKGTGKRLRVGRQLWNYWHKRRSEAR